ncbi:MAG: MFS transporter [Chloroflexota bacterium]|nr:MFS transporter [Chloroflexota bacterium]
MTNRWAVLSILCLARTSMGLHLQVVAAVAPFLVADLGLTYAEIGVLIGIFMLPGVFLALPGGLISRRVGDKATLVTALGLLLAGTGLLAASPNFALAAAARLLSGAGGTLLTMQVAKIATDWFAGRELSTAIGFLLGTFPLGVALAMATLGGVAVASSWRLAVALIAATAVPILLVVTLLYRDLPRQDPPTGPAPTPGTLPHSSTDPAGQATHPAAVAVERLGHPAIGREELGPVLVAGVAFALVNAALVVFTSFTPTLLIERGRSEAQAGVLASWTSWALMPSVLIAGYLLDRARYLFAWLVLSALVTAVACLALPIQEPAWFWIVLFGIASAPVTVGSMALPGQVLRAESRNWGFGLFFTMNYLGFSLLPPVAGYLLDQTRSTAAPIWFGGLLYLAIIPSVLVFRQLRRRRVAEVPLAVDG